VIKEGVPRYITSGELENLRKDSKPPYSDTLIVRLIKAAERERRPVYFAVSLGSSPLLDPYKESGTVLGLAFLVSESTVPQSAAIEQAAETWINEYRTAGLDGWAIKYAGDHHSDRWMAFNYAASLYKMLESMETYAPMYRLDLFRWYRKHLVEIIPQTYNDPMNQMWCRFSDIPEIGSWCREKGYLE
jgi:hypothetical protein